MSASKSVPKAERLEYHNPNLRLVYQRKVHRLCSSPAAPRRLC
jgi:hypothetical protein